MVLGLGLLLAGYCYYSILKKSFSALQAPIAKEFGLSKVDVGTVLSFTVSTCHGRNTEIRPYLFELQHHLR